MVRTWAHTKTRSSTRVAPSSPNRCESRCDTGAEEAGHSLSPSAIRVACQSSSVVAMVAIERQDEIGLAQMAALEAPRALHLADPQRADHPDQHQHREQVDQEGVPALMAQPRERRVLGDHPDHGDHDRRAQHQEAPEDEGVDEARARSAAAACAGRARSSPRARPGASVSPVRFTGAPACSSATRKRTRTANRAPLTASAAASSDGGDGDAYVPRTFLISAEIAGTTSCRSPITA